MPGRYVESGRRTLTAARRRYEGSWLQDLAARLKALEFASWIVVFGASLLLSVLPLVILLSSLADERIDDDLSRHVGVNRQGEHIIRQLFRKTPTHSAGPIILGVLFAFAGTMAVAGSLQVVYERAFGEEHRGWRDFPRLIVWVLVLFVALIAEASYDAPLRRSIHLVGRDIVSFLIVAVFLAWTMHFLLAGRVAWHAVIRPALLTALLWLGLALVSTVYFSSAIVSEHRLYGTLGVIFVLLTWFIAIGAVIMLGVALGTVWQGRAERRR